ncbi:unnamed protein product [Rotaria sp. Silwood2]|nr:unnamed protein product [Rotaria sp. Silwood2]CAF2604274.1 unnamed protein product [Rotaria sp. Silwood2]CAF2974135.1 unnamed protein product [Rotaria sp. Silwood2]CAF3926534.1 unnamed protein product [Rotaria sp. Silwood2]
MQNNWNLITITSLIQNGISHIPSYLLQESVALLHLMLQVDPTKRIRIDDLLCHPWLMNHVYTKPVKWQSIYPNKLDLSCVSEMSLYYGRSVNDIVQELSHKRYDYMTATYFILLNLKSQNKSIRLSRNHTNPRSHINYQHPPPADLLLSHQDKTHVPITNGMRSTIRTNQECCNHKSPNKENIENSQTRQQEQTTPIINSVECDGLNTITQILTSKRISTNKPRKTWVYNLLTISS